MLNILEHSQEQEVRKISLNDQTKWLMVINFTHKWSVRTYIQNQLASKFETILM